ncbi:autoinducer binding domain-containing protein [Mesorhizobium loti]|uniref:Autoinducer binding domain-containing protein n=1 Tax=Rhizobium loti TaxID=381 RepID=A0A8E2WGK7_RHILI|nr:autoinducer binding domain-containing protein [Mesorhizobium loti]QKC82231.1 hypothetical protein EB232_11855 [Mesorhizobium sp. NZP2077]
MSARSKPPCRNSPRIPVSSILPIFSVRVSDGRAVSNYPLKWQERYVSNNYVTLDPVIAQAKRLMCGP